MKRPFCASCTALLPTMGLPTMGLPTMMLLTMGLVGGLSGCSKKPDPAASVRAFIAEHEAYANAGQHEAVIGGISEAYLDSQGRDKAAVARQVERRFRKHARRFVHARPLSVRVDGDSASASMIVALAGQRIGPKDDLLKMSADLIKLELKLERSAQRWLVTSALWRRPSPLDVL